MIKRPFSLNTAGAFLMEALFSVVILAVGLTAVIKGFTMGIEAHTRSQQYLTASVLLDNKLSEFLVDRYVSDTLDSEGRFQEPFSDYRYKVSIEPVSFSDVLKKVTVSVFWKSRQGQRAVDATAFFLSQPQESG